MPEFDRSILMIRSDSTGCQPMEDKFVLRWAFAAAELSLHGQFDPSHRRPRIAWAAKPIGGRSAFAWVHSDMNLSDLPIIVSFRGAEA